MKDAVEELRQHVSVPFDRARAMPHMNCVISLHKIGFVSGEPLPCPSRATM